jgi:hypothetical protein
MRDLILIVALMLLALVFCGCVSLQEGEVKIIRSTTFGVIVSYDPITNLPELKIGWNEVQFMRTLNTAASMEAEHKDISIFTGQGSIRRKIEVSSPAALAPLDSPPPD